MHRHICAWARRMGMALVPLAFGEIASARGLMGLTGLFNVNPLSLYRTQANRLKRAGL